MMHVIIYLKEKNGTGKRLLHDLQNVVPSDSLRVYQRLEDFSEGIRWIPRDSSVVVLLASSRKELSEIINLRDLLLDRRIILMLPDRDGESVSKGHSLYPRFLSYADSDFSEVRAVLNKMMGGMSE